MSASQFVLSGLMLLAGIGIPVMAALNAGLGVRLESAMGAVVILCCVALSLACLTLMFTARPDVKALSTTPPVYFLAGFLFIFYIAGITFAAPRIGLANAVFLVLLGQLISAAVIDHFGLFGAPVSPVTQKRLLGIAFMVVGVYLARKEIIPTLS